MSNELLIGRLSAHPAPSTTTPDDEMIALINGRIRPPESLQAGQVHVRSLRLISDEVNDHGGRFPVEEHDRLCELIIDSPVLIGHDRSRLPVARNFTARSVSDGERQWVQVWFYWMRGSEGDRLAADIDGGVVKEGSIGFEFRRPQCSICGGDIRRCEHIPGRLYTDDTGSTRIAHYEYRDIVRVLETSLVYRGATPGTRIGNDPVFCKTADPPKADHCAVPVCVDSPTEDDRVLGVVLDRQALPSGCRRYIVARRDPDDRTVCDELVAVTRAEFKVGDIVCLRHGRWCQAAKLSSPSTGKTPTWLNWPVFRSGR